MVYSSTHSFNEGSNCTHPQKKKGLSLWQTGFVHRYCHRSWSLKINYVTPDVSTGTIGRLTTGPAFESNKLLSEPETKAGLASADPKALSLPFDPQDNVFLSRAGFCAAFHDRHNCRVCGALPSSSVEGFPPWVSPFQGKDSLQLCGDISQS